jgi:hypothetical protein
MCPQDFISLDHQEGNTARGQGADYKAYEHFSRTTVIEETHGNQSMTHVFAHSVVVPWQ